MPLKRLAVFDLDRTLLDDTSSITGDLERRLAGAMVPGLACTIASGRDIEHIMPYVDQLGWKSVPSIAEQGAVIVDPASGRVLMEQLISRDVVAAALHALQSASIPINVILYGRDSPRLFRNAARAASMDEAGMGWHDGQLPDIPGLDEAVTGDVRKVSIKCVPEHIEAIRELLLSCLGSRANVVKADVNFINIVDAGVSKGMALQWLIDYLGISAADVMAVGDCEADRSMFSVAGVSVAVANADEQTLSMAGHAVPSNNEEGAAVALENFAGGGFGL